MFFVCFSGFAYRVCLVLIVFFHVERMIAQGSAYEGAVFALFLQFPAEFPQKPPEMRFVTEILHVNVNCYGRICHSIFGRNWMAETSVSEVLDHVYGLLLAPEMTDPIDTNLAFEFHRAAKEGGDAYRHRIAAHCAKHARAMTRAQWTEALSGQGDDDDDVVFVGSTIGNSSSSSSGVSSISSSSSSSSSGVSGLKRHASELDSGDAAQGSKAAKLAPDAGLMWVCDVCGGEPILKTSRAGHLASVRHANAIHKAATAMSDSSSST